MPETETPRRGRRLLLVSLAGICLAVGALVWASSGSAAGDGSDDLEVCDTTVYEGCPARWDYLLEE